MDIKEIWKEINGFNSRYFISNKGRVKSVFYYKGNIKGRKKGKRIIYLKTKLKKNGYEAVQLWNREKGKYDNLYIHRLIAIHFIPNPENKSEVNHINEIKDDNIVHNLEWVTRSENMNHGSNPERISERQSIKVSQYDLDNNLIKLWSSTKECNDNGFNKKGVRDCCKGMRDSYKGFRWRYAVFIFMLLMFTSPINSQTSISGISREQKLEIVSTIESYKSVLIELDLQQQLNSQCNELNDLYKKQIEVKDKLIGNLQAQIDRYNKKEGVYETEIKKQKTKNKLAVAGGILAAVLGFLIR